MFNNAKLIKLGIEVLFSQNKRLVEKLKFEDMTVNHYRILNLVRNKKVNTVNQLAEYIWITPASVSVAVDKLEEMGYLKKVHSKEDKRSFSLKTTIKGKTKLVRFIKSASKDFLKILKELDKEEIEVLIKTLEKIKNLS